MKMKRSILKLIFIMCSLLFPLLTGCEQARETEVKRLIGVSLANRTDEWRMVLKKELESEAARYEGLKLIFLDAGDSVEKQKNDLKELIEYGAELLIISPVDIEELITPVEQIYYEGVPVLLLDRAVKGFEYTCFFGVDDRILAAKEADALPLLTGKGADERITILNILIDDFTGRQRAGLFKEAVSGNTEVRQLIVKKGTRDATEDILLERKELLTDVDLILTQNDYMAHGAALALKTLGMRDIKIMGADGFSGKDGGIEMVREGIIDATLVCPTGGREAISYASSFLDGMKDGPKQIIVRNRLVTGDTVESYLEEENEVREKNIVSVGYVQIDEDTGFRRANTGSYRDAASDSGIELDIVECGNMQEQLSAFETFISQGKDAIILSPIVEDGWKDAFERAKEKGVPVILSDREVNLDDELYSVFVGADFVEEGARCMRWISENMPDKGETRILELAGTRGSSPAIGRGRGFREMMKDRPDCRIIASLNGNFSKDEGYLAIKDYLEKNGDDFDVVFCHNDDMMLGAIDALKEAGIKPGEDVRMLSVDGTREALLALQNGEADFVAECTPLIGRDAMRVIEKLRKGEELPLKVISSEGSFDKDTPDNVFRGRKY